jgi:hypothetical protein
MKTSRHRHGFRGSTVVVNASISAKDMPVIAGQLRATKGV